MAVACGTPQLVVGREHEQMLSGDRLFAVGAGRRLLADELPPGDVGADIIGTEAAKLLDRLAYGAAGQRLRGDRVAVDASRIGLHAGPADHRFPEVEPRPRTRLVRRPGSTGLGVIWARFIATQSPATPPTTTLTTAPGGLLTSNLGEF